MFIWFHHNRWKDVVNLQIIGRWKEILSSSNAGEFAHAVRMYGHWTDDLVRRECSFISKVLLGEQVGALGVIIIDNDHVAIDQYVDMIDDLTQRTVQLPALFVKYRDGYDRSRSLPINDLPLSSSSHLILNSIAKNHVIGARINIPLNLTYDSAFTLPNPPGHYWS